MREALFANWRHVFKLDPDRPLDDEMLDAICMSGTDAVMIGGSSGVTFDNTVDLLSRIRRYEVPCALEVSSADAAVPGFDLYLIPMVLNTQRAEWIVGRQAEGVREYGSFIPWEDTFAEGYIILNKEAEAARLTEASTELDEADTLAYVRLADRLMRLPVIYLEYSGRFGDMQLVQRAHGLLTQGRLFYGGGIDSVEKAGLAAAAADTVIVGNVIYSDLAAALQTVRAVKEIGQPL
ncbi:heptaprenylglyceryl phosphate synthase [Paenibacillus abyssi]|uniref:Heptaprenylglyceryl phosphate synthase n=1 Tax=Paenibacillus abyssi TaxID=1340531 RepID=A0A917CNB7_9BACL|nr:heptaprenylglyceryl phosphate synthase [Paenibacillus abyssi]GGF91093.1 heptaprenylglyceryl phosphate synthase [Paenibacillus abyssi]